MTKRALVLIVLLIIPVVNARVILIENLANVYGGCTCDATRSTGWALNGSQTTTIYVINSSQEGFLNNSQICTASNGLCGGVGDGTGGWTNTSTDTYTTLNVSTTGNFSAYKADIDVLTGSYYDSYATLITGSEGIEVRSNMMINTLNLLLYSNYNSIDLNDSIYNKVDSLGMELGTWSGPLQRATYAEYRDTYILLNGTTISSIAQKINIDHGTQINSYSATDKTLILKEKPAQSANPFEVQDSTGAHVASVQADGDLNTTNWIYFGPATARRRIASTSDLVYLQTENGGAVRLGGVSGVLMGAFAPSYYDSAYMDVVPNGIIMWNSVSMGNTRNVGLAWQSDRLLKIIDNSTGYGDLKLRNITLTGLNGTGNDYACIDSNGKLYRSDAPCA